MKLESDPGLGIQTPPRKSYNPFDSDDEETNSYLKSNIKGFDIKSFEENADSLTFHLENPNLSWEEAVLGRSAISDHLAPGDDNGEEVVFRKDTELFTDKTVTDCELPELVVCYNTGYNSVKDIGVDDGVPIHDKVWIKNRDDHETVNLSYFPALNDDSHDDHIHVNEPEKLTFVEELKSKSEDNMEFGLMKDRLDSNPLELEHSAEKDGVEDLHKGDEMKHDSSKKEINPVWQEPLVKTKSDAEFHDASDTKLSEVDEVNHAKEKNASKETLENHGKDAVALEHSDESSTNSSHINGADATTESIIENQREEASTSQTLEQSASEKPAGSGTAKALSYDSKMDSGSIILDFNSSSVISGNEAKEEQSQPKATVEKPPLAQMMSRDDEEITGNAAIMSMDNRVHGETSFSAAMAPPASITFMSSHAHNGSISHRSESSCGSTRSFAFPVLQGEWNSSPVRMAKAEQRGFRKHRGWVHSVMCCRF